MSKNNIFFYSTLLFFTVFLVVAGYFFYKEFIISFALPYSVVGQYKEYRLIARNDNCTGAELVFCRKNGSIIYEVNLKGYYDQRNSNYNNSGELICRQSFDSRSMDFGPQTKGIIWCPTKDEACQKKLEAERKIKYKCFEEMKITLQDYICEAKYIIKPRSLCW